MLNAQFVIYLSILLFSFSDLVSLYPIESTLKVLNVGIIGGFRQKKKVNYNLKNSKIWLELLFADGQFPLKR